MAAHYEVRIIEMGILASSEASAESPPVATRDEKWCPSCRVVSSAEWSGESVQFWRIQVRRAGTDGHEHVIVSAHFPSMTPERRGAAAAILRQICPGAILSFTLTDAPGRSEVSAEACPTEAAAAVAEIKRGAGWDESPSFRLIVGAAAFDVVVTWRGEFAHASLNPAET